MQQRHPGLQQGWQQLRPQQIDVAQQQRINRLAGQLGCYYGPVVGVDGGALGWIAQQLNAVLKASLEDQNSVDRLAAGSGGRRTQVRGIAAQHPQPVASPQQAPGEVGHAAAIAPQLLRRVEVGDQQDVHGGQPGP